MLGLLKTADVVRRVISDVLEPYGVTPQQYNVLRILRGAGEDGIPTLSIRDRMIEQAPGVTRLIDRLVERGWAERRRCDEDRRQVFCQISPSGLDLLARLDGPIESSHDQAMLGLDAGDLEELIRLLDRVRAAHSAPDPDCSSDPL